MSACVKCGAQNGGGARFCGVCGAALTGTAPASVAGAVEAGPATGLAMLGREIAGRYRVLAKLGEGGMGAVFRAEQISLKRTVAIKLLRPEVAADPMLLRRFNAEAELVAKLSHPNTVGIYDFGQDSDGTLFIAMELIDGRSLRAVIHREAPLLPRRALAIAAQIAASLSDAHAHAIVHRDLKPDNVMLQDRGRERDVVRVLDFGIAKLRDDARATQRAMTQAGDMVGTPQYMAPEQIRGEAIDGRTDIYALGCLVYELVTARLPHDAATVLAMLSKHLLDEPVPPSQRRPELALPPALDALILGAMAKDPRARPATMDAFAEQIAAVMAALPASAPSALASGAVPMQPGPPPGTPPPGIVTPVAYSAVASGAQPPMSVPGMPGSAAYPAPSLALPTPPAMPSVPPASPARPPSRIAAIAGVVGLVALITTVAIVNRRGSPASEPPPASGSSGSAGSGSSGSAAPSTPDPWAVPSPGASPEASAGSAAAIAPPPPPPGNDPWAATPADEDSAEDSEGDAPAPRGPGRPHGSGAKDRHAGGATSRAPAVDGRRVAVGQGVQIVIPAGFQIAKQNGVTMASGPRGVKIWAGPLMIPSDDPQELARFHAAANHLIVDRTARAPILGANRPMALFHGVFGGVKVFHSAYALIGPHYRIGVALQCPIDLTSDPAVQRLFDEMIGPRIMLP